MEVIKKKKSREGHLDFWNAFEVAFSSVWSKYTFTRVIRGTHHMAALGRENSNAGSHWSPGSNLKLKICHLKSESLLANSWPVDLTIWAVGVSVSSLAIVFQLENCQPMQGKVHFYLTDRRLVPSFLWTLIPGASDYDRGLTAVFTMHSFPEFSCYFMVSAFCAFQTQPGVSGHHSDLNSVFEHFKLVAKI